MFSDRFYNVTWSSINYNVFMMIILLCMYYTHLRRLFEDIFNCNICLWNITIFIFKKHTYGWCTLKKIYYRRVLYILLVYLYISLHYFKDTRVYYCIIYYDVVIFFFHRNSYRLGSWLYFFRGRPRRYNQSLYHLHPRGISNVLYCSVDTYIARYTHTHIISK